MFLIFSVLFVACVKNNNILTMSYSSQPKFTMLFALCTSCMYAISNLNNTITYEVSLAFEVGFVM